MASDRTWEIFDQWAAAYARGEQPDPRLFLEQAAPEQADLQRLMDRFLRASPRPEPAAEDVEIARAWIRGESPLVELRSRAGLKRDDVISALIDQFQLRPDQRPAVRRYYHQLEAGELPADGVSVQLLGFLADQLQVTKSAILNWRPRRLSVSPAYRARSEPAEVESALASGLEPDDEEVRALFHSDR